MFDPVLQSINEIVQERDCLKVQLAEANQKIETLREECLAWHARVEENKSTVTIMASLETLQELWNMARPGLTNPCIRPED